MIYVSRSPLQKAKSSQTAKLLSILLLSSLLTTSCSKPKPEAKGPPPTPVQLQTLRTQSLQDSADFVGTLEAVQAVELKPQIEGRITKILVRPGDRVEKGKPLFILTPDQTVPQYNSSEAAVNAAIAARQTALQQLQVAKSQASSSLAESENAQVNKSRSQFLANQGAASRYVADNAATEAKVTSEAFNVTQDQIRAAQAAVNQAEAQLREAQDQANAAKVSVDFKQVEAPIAGAVGNITLKPGDIVTTGQTLTTIIDNDFFDLQIPIPISRAGQLRKGLPLQLLDLNTSNSLGLGSIYFIDATANPDAQSILTRARFANSKGNLRNAQSLKARVIWDKKPGVLVPTTAVTTIGVQNFVFVAKADDGGSQTTSSGSRLVARQTPVTLGAIQGQDYQVVSGLKPGDQVVVAGVLRLKDGLPIEVRGSSTSSASSSSSSPQLQRSPQS